MAKKRRPRRTFDEDFKQQLLDEIAGGKKLIDVAKEHGLQPSQISLWKKNLGGGSRKAKKAGRSKATAQKAVATQAAAPAAKPVVSAVPSTTHSSNYVAQLERMIGQLTIENVRLRSELEGR